jgi:hypothetical protein
MEAVAMPIVIQIVAECCQQQPELIDLVQDQLDRGQLNYLRRRTQSQGQSVSLGEGSSDLLRFNVDFVLIKRPPYHPSGVENVHDMVVVVVRDVAVQRGNGRQEVG